MLLLLIHTQNVSFERPGVSSLIYLVFDKHMRINTSHICKQVNLTINMQQCAMYLLLIVLGRRGGSFKEGADQLHSEVAQI
jgi:hypothetical protein